MKVGSIVKNHRKRGSNKNVNEIGIILEMPSKRWKRLRGSNVPNSISADVVDVYWFKCRKTFWCWVSGLEAVVE